MTNTETIKPNRRVTLTNEKAVGDKNPNTGLTIRVLGCYPLSRCGRGCIAFSPRSYEQPMIDTNDTDDGENSTKNGAAVQGGRQ